MKRFFEIFVLGTVLMMCCGCGDAGSFAGGEGRSAEGSGETASARRYAADPGRYTDVAMGTVIQQTIYAVDEEAAEEFSEEVMALLTGLEEELLSRRLETSELYRVNEAAGSEEGYPVSEELGELLSSCMELSGRSGGAFDVTLGALVILWDIDRWAAGEQEEFRLPEAAEVRQALARCGGDRLRLEREDKTEGREAGGYRVFLPEGMILDPGAVGKGYALSKLCASVQGNENVGGGVISLGGSILTFGGKPDGSAWRVGIVDPEDTSSQVGILTLTGQWCISTSGDYERYVELDGVRYHHILDPETGYPAVTDVRGVTILSKDGLLSDALSTACFILGPEEGLKLTEEYEAEALFVMRDGELIMSEGMREYFAE